MQEQDDIMSKIRSCAVSRPLESYTALFAGTSICTFSTVALDAPPAVVATSMAISFAVPIIGFTIEHANKAINAVKEKFSPSSISKQREGFVLELLRPIPKDINAEKLLEAYDLNMINRDEFKSAFANINDQTALEQFVDSKKDEWIDKTGLTFRSEREGMTT